MFSVLELPFEHILSHESSEKPFALLITQISKKDYTDFSLFFNAFLIRVIVPNQSNQRSLGFFRNLYLSHITDYDGINQVLIS